MKIVLDTNVLMSGIFFSGPPCQILKAWQKDKFNIVISENILTEYRSENLAEGNLYEQGKADDLPNMPEKNAFQKEEWRVLF